MVAADPDHLILYTEYVGSPPTRYTSSLERQVDELVRRLEREYGLRRKWYRSQPRPRLSNVAMDGNGQLRLLDFGPPFKHVAPNQRLSSAPDATDSV